MGTFKTEGTSLVESMKPSKLNVLASVMPGAKKALMEKINLPRESRIFHDYFEMFDNDPAFPQKHSSFADFDSESQELPLILACELRKSVKVPGDNFFGVGEVKRGVRNVSTAFERGEVIGILGEPKCGAGLFLRMLTGEIIADSGAVYYDGININSMKDKMHRISYCPENFHLWEKFDDIRKSSMYELVLGS